MHSVLFSCLYFPAYTVNSCGVSPTSGMLYRYLSYLLRYLGSFTIPIRLQGYSSCILYMSYMHLFLPLFLIATLFHTSSDMRLAFLYTNISVLHPITVSSCYHVVQPYFIYLYAGISHEVRNNTSTLLHTCAPSRSNISLTSFTLRWSPLSRLYLRILFTFVFTLYIPPYPTSI